MSNRKVGKINVEDMLNKARVDAEKPANETDINDFIDSNLSESTAKEVKDILKDEKKTKALLNSEAAKELFKKFFGGKGNG